MIAIPLVSLPGGSSGGGRLTSEMNSPNLPRTPATPGSAAAIRARRVASVVPAPGREGAALGSESTVTPESGPFDDDPAPVPYGSDAAVPPVRPNGTAVAMPTHATSL